MKLKKEIVWAVRDLVYADNDNEMSQICGEHKLLWAEMLKLLCFVCESYEDTERDFERFNVFSQPSVIVELRDIWQVRINFLAAKINSSDRGNKQAGAIGG